MSVDRRDFFKFVGGSAVGFVFTPVPWMLLNDTSKWSQNWSWTPRPATGEIRARFTTCTLCPAGCGVRARCVGDQPVSLAGVAAHPASQGKLCPIGLAGHQQVYHPRRVRQALYHGKPVTIEQALAGVRAAIDRSAGKGHVAVFDARPGRAASVLYRRFAAKVPDGIYLGAPAADGATLRTLESQFETPYGPLGIDLENARSILSFGTPILDGWGAPGRVFRNRGHFRLLQIEAGLSRTASLADVWLPIRPGTEAILALSIANVLTRENLYDPNCARRATDFREYVQFAARYTPDYAAALCGVPAARIVETARDLARQAPPIVIGDTAPEIQIAISGLNLLFGSVGRTSGILPRSGVNTRVTPWTDTVENGSIRVVVAAGEVPWGPLGRKLAPDAVVVSLSPWNDGRSAYVIPAPVYLESLQDVPEPSDAAATMLSLSVPLLSPPPYAIEPAEFLARLEPSIGKLQNEIGTRIEAVYKTRRGEVISYKDGSSHPLTDLASAAALQKSLMAGAIWVDKKMSEAPAPSFALMGHGRLRSLDSQPPKNTDVLSIDYGWRGVKALSVSPILSKLYQESGLRDSREA